jgi:hypothetical protein
MGKHRDARCYDILKQKIKELERQPGATQQRIVDALCDDDDIEWNAIYQCERTAETWEVISSHWKRNVIKSFLTAGRFTHGGDHKSEKYRGRMQQAIIAYVENQAATEDRTTQDEDTVAEKCIEEVRSRWRSSTQDGTILIHRMVRRVVHASCSLWAVPQACSLMTCLVGSCGPEKKNSL